jgi:hypothetical protein
MQCLSTLLFFRDNENTNTNLQSTVFRQKIIYRVLFRNLYKDQDSELFFFSYINFTALCSHYTLQKLRRQLIHWHFVLYCPEEFIDIFGFRSRKRKKVPAFVYCMLQNRNMFVRIIYFLHRVIFGFLWKARSTTENLI